MVRAIPTRMLYTLIIHMCVTIHRMCIQSKDELSIFLQPGSRHIGAMAERATELGKPLPISVSIGVDPAISITSCFEPPTTPLVFIELTTRIGETNIFCEEPLVGYSLSSGAAAGQKRIPYTAGHLVAYAACML